MKVRFCCGLLVLLVGACGGGDDSSDDDASSGNEGEGSAPSGGSGPSGGSESTTSSGDALSFQADIVPIFEASCGANTAGCHARDSFLANVGDDCRGWLSLKNEPLGSESYSGDNVGESTGCPDMSLHERLLELDAWLCGQPAYPSLDNVAYVTPGDPDSSLLYLMLGDDPTAGGNCQKAEGMRTTRMPLEPLPSLSSDDMGKIRDWIEQGAKNN